MKYNKNRICKNKNKLIVKNVLNICRYTLTLLEVVLPGSVRGHEVQTGLLIYSKKLCLAYQIYKKQPEG